MFIYRFTLISAAALIIGVSAASAESLIPLRASFDDLNIKPAGDFPYGGQVQQQQEQVQVASSSVAWEGRLRLGFGTFYDSTASIGATSGTSVFDSTGKLIGTTGGSSGQSRVTEFNATGHIGVVGKTQSPWGEVGVSVGLLTSVGQSAFFDGESFNVGSDGSFAYLKFSPNLTLTGCLLYTSPSPRDS